MAMSAMDRRCLARVLCMLCALVASVCGQQSAALPQEDDKKPTDDSKFIPITGNAPKFSIGLGVLSPSYTQKFGDDGKGKLDFAQDSGGFTYSLNSLSHGLSKSTDRSGSDDKKYSTDTMKTAGDSHQLSPTSQYSPTSYSLVSNGMRSDSLGSGYAASQAGPPPLPTSYGPYGGAGPSQYGQSPAYGSMPGYGPPGYGPMQGYQGYPSNVPQYSQSAYNPTAMAPPTSMQSSPAQSPYGPQPVASAPVPQPYPAPAQPQPQQQYSPYGAYGASPQMASPYGAYGQPSYGQPMSPYGMSPYGAPSMSPQMSPYGGYASQSPYGGGAGYGMSGMSGMSMYGSPSQPPTSMASYPYGGGSTDPLANLSPSDINTLRELYGASSSMRMSYMSPYSGMGGGMGGGAGGSSAYGGMGGYGGGLSSSSSGGGLSSLISLFG